MLSLSESLPCSPHLSPSPSQWGWGWGQGRGSWGLLAPGKWESQGLSVEGLGKLPQKLCLFSVTLNLHVFQSNHGEVTLGWWSRWVAYLPRKLCRGRVPEHGTIGAHHIPGSPPSCLSLSLFLHPQSPVSVSYIKYPTNPSPQASL